MYDSIACSYAKCERMFASEASQKKLSGPYPFSEPSYGPVLSVADKKELLNIAQDMAAQVHRIAKDNPRKGVRLTRGGEQQSQGRCLTAFFLSKLKEQLAALRANNTLLLQGLL